MSKWGGIYLKLFKARPFYYQQTKNCFFPFNVNIINNFILHNNIFMEIVFGKHKEIKKKQKKKQKEK